MDWLKKKTHIEKYARDSVLVLMQQKKRLSEFEAKIQRFIYSEFIATQCIRIGAPRLHNDFRTNK